MQIVVVRSAAKLLGVLLAFWGLAGVAHASCDVEALPSIVDGSAAAWLDALPGRVAAPLAERGFAFPEPGFIEACPELISALLVVERPADEIFGRLIQTTRHAEFMREVGSIDPVSRSSHGAVDRYSMPVFLTRIDYTIRHTWDAAARRIRWALSDEHVSDSTSWRRVCSRPASQSRAIVLERTDRPAVRGSRQGAGSGDHGDQQAGLDLFGVRTHRQHADQAGRGARRDGALADDVDGIWFRRLWERR